MPLDGWFPYLVARLVVLPPLPEPPAHAHRAHRAHVTGAGDQTTYLWILYLLLALWPISVYSRRAAARLEPLDRRGRGGSSHRSIVSAPGYGYEHGSYTWQGYGVYSQLWGMWLLPLAWGLTWRAVTRGQVLRRRRAALALTMACHFITGYLAVLTVGVWVLVAGSGLPASRRTRRARRRRLGARSRPGCSCR